MTRMRRTIAVGLVALVAAVLAACDDPPASVLRRPSDPVVLTGDDLPRVPGVMPGDVVAFSRRAGAWLQIPVQVDERHEANLAVVHNRPAEAGVDRLVYSDPKTYAGADDVATIDLNDEIVFMASDAGGKAGPDTADPAGVIPDSGFEFTLTDAGDGARQGFVYLFRTSPGSGLDQAAGRNYVTYDFQLERGEYPEDYVFEPNGPVVGDPPNNPPPNANPEDSTISTDAYSTHFDDRWREDGLRITAGAATGVDILDRHKVIPYAGPDVSGPGYPPSCIRNENTAAASHGAFVSNIDGPVRAIRDYIGFNSGQYTQRRHVYYAARQDTTTFLRAHPLPYGPDDLFDYNDAAFGMRYRNNVNRAQFTIDGVADDVKLGELAWEQVTGAQGTVTHVHRFEIVPIRDVELPVMSSFYVDDATPPPDEFVQCTGDSKAIATSGPAILSPTVDTDPRDRGGPDRDYDLTGYRTQYYDPPGQTVAAAQQRDRWARQPLAVTSRAWTG